MVFAKKNEKTKKKPTVKLFHSCRGPKISKDVVGVDLDGDGKVSKDEMMMFIERDARLWAMLSINTNIPEAKCREIARDVAYQMAKKPVNISLKDMSYLEKIREPTIEEFHAFVSFVKSPQGHKEFFHRTVFAAFDDDGNGYLESHELDRFLDIFYEVDSIFAGDIRLPPKHVFKQIAMKELDRNADGKLEFHELQGLISGDVSSFERVFVSL